MKENNVTKEETFEYTYSAKRQEEIEAIKKKYMPPEEDKMEQLRKLDASVTSHAIMWSILVGVIGTLIMGSGMSCTMVGPESLFVPGIILGVIGLTVMGTAYPLYVKIVKKQREKIAPQILALAEELSVMEVNMTNSNESFEYTYSAKQQKEIEEIRKKYLPKEEDKMETLRRLDRSAEKPGMMTSITVGVIGTLFLGVGMCCTMVWAETLFVPGIVIGLIGLAIASQAYPIYKKITRKQREKIANQILELSNELSL